MICVNGDVMTVNFDHFGIENYALFLKAKKLPESNTEFVPETEGYRITAPARFASLLGVVPEASGKQALEIAAHLYDDQAAITKMALDAKRFAIWSDCGLGKTAVFLEWARHVMHRTGGRVLIVTQNEIVKQTIEEAQKFYGDRLLIVRLKSRDEMKEWCAGRVKLCRCGADVTNTFDDEFDGEKHVLRCRSCGAELGDVEQMTVPRLAITNYEKWNPESLELQIVTEARMLAGIILDESNRLACGGGKQKWALIKSCRGIEYKLSCTATPAPNEVMEFASQASFLEKMRDEGEILWTFFRRDEKTHRWTVKTHAREAFFRFMANWSIYMRDPRRYGWRLDMPDVPEPEYFVYEIDMTEQQLEVMRTMPLDEGGQCDLYESKHTNAIQRMKLSQVAKGFRYRKGQNGAYDSIDSRKPDLVADLIRQEKDLGLQVLVWTEFDAESNILMGKLLREDGVELLVGKTKEKDRLRILESFRSGETRVLLSRPAMLGFGMNFQFVGSMIFSGWSDSYVRFYQALRRAYRQGQTKRLRVHLPVVRELEGDMLDNLYRKQALHLAGIEEMERHYIDAKNSLGVWSTHERHILEKMTEVV